MKNGGLYRWAKVMSCRFFYRYITRQSLLSGAQTRDAPAVNVVDRVGVLFHPTLPQDTPGSTLPCSIPMLAGEFDAVILMR